MPGLPRRYSTALPLSDRDVGILEGQEAKTCRLTFFSGMAGKRSTEEILCTCTVSEDSRVLLAVEQHGCIDPLGLIPKGCNRGLDPRF